jgi:hypothetical protein
MHRGVGNFFDDFVGIRIYPSTAVDGPWVYTKQGAGSPSAKTVTGVQHALRLLLDNTSEAQAICVSFGDILQFQADYLLRVRFRMKVVTPDITTGQTFSFGLSNARNNTWHSMTQYLNFALQASTALVCESNDNTTVNNGVATGLTLSTTFREFEIDFSQGLKDVRFYAGDANNHRTRVAPKTVFNVAQLAGQFLQPNVQLQKASGATTPAIDWDYIDIDYRRAA